MEFNMIVHILGTFPGTIVGTFPGTIKPVFNSIQFLVVKIGLLVWLKKTCYKAVPDCHFILVIVDKHHHYQCSVKMRI